jgi:mRNA interferase RelE/StbE
VPTWIIELIPEAVLDFKALDGSVRKLVLKQLHKLEQDPRYGQPLGNKAGINLEGFYKLYADKKNIRIVYDVNGQVVRVIAIDRREDMEVYQVAMRRIKDNE